MAINYFGHAVKALASCRERAPSDDNQRGEKASMGGRPFAGVFAYRRVIIVIYNGVLYFAAA